MFKQGAGGLLTFVRDDIHNCGATVYKNVSLVLIQGVPPQGRSENRASRGDLMLEVGSSG